MFHSTAFILSILISLGTLKVHAYERVESSEKFDGVQLTQTVTLDELDNIQLKAVAHALRTKKIAFLNFKVYVGEFLIPPDLAWTHKAQDFISTNPAGIQMTLLRDVPANKMVEAFREGTEKNHIDPHTKPFQDFLTAVKKSGDIKKNEVFIIARKKDEKTDRVLVLIPGRLKEIISGPVGWSDNILRLWVGKPTDSGLENFQKEIFK